MKKTVSKPKKQTSRTGFNISAFEIAQYLDERADRESRKLDNFKEDIEQKFQKIQDEMKKLADSDECIKNDLAEIKNIKINGSVGIKDVLQGLYAATAEIREAQQLKGLLSNYVKTHKIYNFFFNNKVGKAVLIVGGIFALLSIAHVLGLEKIDPVEWIKIIWKIVFPSL